MKFKLNKEIILTFIITAIIFSSIGVLAVSLTAKEIGFTSTNEGWEVDNVEDAMNDLYEIGIEASNTNIHNLGEGRSFDISSIVGSENVGKYTSDNFYCISPQFSLTAQTVTDNDTGDHAYGATSFTAFDVSYDNTTGVVTISGGVLTLKVIDYQYKNNQVETARQQTVTKDITPTVYFFGK